MAKFVIERELKGAGMLAPEGALDGSARGSSLIVG